MESSFFHKELPRHELNPLMPTPMFRVSQPRYSQPPPAREEVLRRQNEKGGRFE